MDKQAIYNQVRDHLLKQGEQSRQPARPSTFGPVEGVCAYRGEGGKMCAVGCLIKDEFYSPELENKTCDTPQVAEVLGKSGIPTDWKTIDFLRDLQEIHDSDLVDGWESKLHELATQNGLTT